MKGGRTMHPYLDILVSKALHHCGGIVADLLLVRVALVSFEKPKVPSYSCMTV